MIGRTISHYEIVAEIGGGGMGQVYQARDTRLGVVRALKFIHPHLVSDEEFKARFLREAQTASALDHPNICTIHEVDETENGRPFLCMTYYEGQTLTECLKDGPLPIADILPIGYAIGQGLACAHRQGIFHRDIKPDNVMVSDDGFIKILDFGLAKLATGADLTAPATNLGTARYMAPEQIDGSGADARTDVWALGVVLYQLATGRVPFDGEHDPAVLYSILHEPATPLREIDPTLPDAFVDTVESCLVKDPEQRCASVEDLLEGLVGAAAEIGQNTLLGGLTASALHTNGAPANRRRRRPWPWLVAAVILVASAVGGGWWHTREPGPYSTELRLAVMPLENQSHPRLDPLTQGLTVLLVDLFEESSAIHGSMWVVPDRLVRYADLRDLAAAENTFGVNRILTGNVQRHANGHLLRLVLRDAATTERLVSASIGFDTRHPQALVDSLPWVLAKLADLDQVPDHWNGHLYPGDGDGLESYLAGLGLLAERDPAGAVEELRPLAIRQPSFAGGIEMLGWALWQSYLHDGRDAQRDSAIMLVQQASGIEPHNWRPLYHLGEILRLLGRNEEALAAFDEACAMKPGFPLLSDHRSRVLDELGRRSEAENALAAAIGLRPDYFEVHRLLAGHFTSDDNELEAAAREYRKTIELAPEDSYTHQRLGVLYNGLGDIPRAREHFERAFQLVPNFENVSNVGRMCYIDGNYEEAARYYELALDMGGINDSATWGNLAIALYWTDGRRAESVTRFERAIELLTHELDSSPNDTGLISNLIEYHAMAGKTDETLQLIKQYEPLASGDAALLYRIGDAYELVGDRNAALRTLGEAIRNGFAIEEIRATKELEDLCADPIFVQMTGEKPPSEVAPTRP